MTTSPTLLLAILANPSPLEHTRTELRVQLAGDLLGFQQTRIANLFAVPSRSSRDIQMLGHDETGWIAARVTLSQILPAASAVLLAFGLIPVRGEARGHYEAQLSWLRTQLDAHSHTRVWQVGNARHPSRWHQYLSDRHGRTSGGAFDERLRESLHQVPVAEALRGGTRGLSVPRTTNESCTGRCR